MALPLDGIRIIDASTILAAPLSSTLLAELGAEVVKVEAPLVGDATRGFDHQSRSWNVTNRLKKSVTIDLRLGDGQTVFYELCRSADVVVLNFRPSTARRWKIDYDSLREVNPALVVLHLTAFGLGGPYEDHPGFGRVAESFAGLTYISGYPDRPPVFPGYPIADGLGGVYGAFLLMVALRHRDRTGEGQLVDLGLYEPVLRILEDFVVSYGSTGAIKERIGNDQPHSCPNGIFPTADGEWVVLPASTKNMWDRLVELLSDETLAELDDVQKRIAQRERVNAAVTRFTVQHRRDDLLSLLREKGIACGQVNTVADIAMDEQVEARGNLARVFDPKTGEDLLVQAPAGRFSALEPRLGVGPGLGEHTDEVLSGLGFTVEQIDKLRAVGAI